MRNLKSNAELCLEDQFIKIKMSEDFFYRLQVKQDYRTIVQHSRAKTSKARTSS